MIITGDIVEISKGVYWLGVRRNRQLEVNVYLRIFKNGDKTINLIIDPGPPVIFDLLVDRIKKIIGGLEKIQLAFINHQDPDVSLNIMYLNKFNPKLKVLCTEDTWRLIHFYGLESKNFQAIDKFKSLRGRLSTGHVVRFVPTPFCHFRGAAMLYDEESRILFSGDFLGGIIFSDDLFATPDNWSGIKTFHQIYMPTQDAIRLAVENIRKLNPPPRIIAPQHGAIIKSDLIDEFLQKMYNLPVGLDLIGTGEVEKDYYIEAINEILNNLSGKLSKAYVKKVLKQFKSDGSFPNLFDVVNEKIVDIKVSPRESFELLVEALIRKQPKQIRETVKGMVLRASVDWNLPLCKFVMEEEVDVPSILLDEFDRDNVN